MSGAVTASSHPAFPIASGDHALDCATCHTDPTTFSVFNCIGCHTHDQAPTDLVHNSVAGYVYTSPGCYQCHPAPVRAAFSHTGITGNCALCHAVGASFAALPVSGFTHIAITTDCGSCHNTTAWSTGSMPTTLVHDAARNVTVTALVPTYAGTSIQNVSSVAEVLPMSMNHGASALASAVLSNCAGCHAGAATGTYYPGVLHSSLVHQGLAQPATCVDCHTDAAPTGFVGPLAANPPRNPATGEMKHDAVAWTGGAPTTTHLVTTECSVCHVSPSTAQTTWATSPSGSGVPVFHASLTKAGLAQPSSCVDCHANDTPAGLTNSSMLTTASNDSTTGVPAGTQDQITHADVNVTRFDCNFCHTQTGPSQVAGVQGKEWAQASFHTSFSAATPLTMNGTTGRCSDCHMNVKPGSTFTAQDHSTFTSTPGTEDCSSCHTWPGTGTAAAPNWLGGGNAPQYIVVGGFSIPQPPAATPTTQAGIANLPHPSTATLACSSCHTGGVGGKGAIGYDHASTLISTNCNSCHEAGTDLIGTLWNGSTTQGAGAGDSRPYTITSLTATRGGGDSCSNITTPYHFYPVDCRECHSAPAGTGTTATGTAYTNAWSFPHTEGNMTNPSTCQMCHNTPGCGT